MCGRLQSRDWRCSRPTCESWSEASPQSPWHPTAGWSRNARIGRWIGRAGSIPGPFAELSEAPPPWPRWGSSRPPERACRTVLASTIRAASTLSIRPPIVTSPPCSAVSNAAAGICRWRSPNLPQARTNWSGGRAPGVRVRGCRVVPASAPAVPCGFLVDVEAAQGDTAAMIAVAKDPIYSRFDRVARRVLWPRLSLGDSLCEKLWLRRTYELYEYWCFFRVAEFFGPGVGGPALARECGYGERSTVRRPRRRPPRGAGRTAADSSDVPADLPGVPAVPRQWIQGLFHHG